MTTSATASTSTSRARRPATWLDYVAGTAWALSEAGLPLTGLRGVIASTLPPNAGLSSSAAIELAAAWALLDEAAPAVDPFRLAQTLPARGERLRRGPERADGPVRRRRAASLARRCCSIAGRSTGGRSRCRPTSRSSSATPGRTRHLERSEYNLRRSQCDAAVAALAAIDPRIREPARRHARGPPRCGGPPRSGRLPARRARRHRERPGRGDRGRPRSRRPGRRRAPLRREPRLAPRPVRGQLPGARRDGRDRHGGPRRRRRPDDRRRVRWLHRSTWSAPTPSRRSRRRSTSEYPRR